MLSIGWDAEKPENPESNAHPASGGPAFADKFAARPPPNGDMPLLLPSQRTLSFFTHRPRSLDVTIRNYRPGDETAQAAIFNAAAGSLPGCKPASVDDLRRRTQAPSFDPNLWFYADEGGEIVGYCSAQANGRIGFPWCKPGSERFAEPLFAAAGRSACRGLGRAYAAYAASLDCPSRLLSGP